MFGKKLAGVTRSVGAIQSDKELAGATREVCDLISKGSLSSLDKKRFQTLVELIENYEEINHPIPEPSHAALLEHLLASRAGGVPRLAEVTGISRAVIRNILDGKREIGSRESKELAKYFHVEPSVFESDATSASIAIEVISAPHAARQIQSWFHIEGTAAKASSTPEYNLPITSHSFLQMLSLGLVHHVGGRSAAACG